MKALNFLEWYFTQKGNYRWYDNQNEFINHTYKVLDFYNRPFSMDMLVNPIKDKYYESQDMMRVTVISDKWSQHESLRLFEGWEWDVMSETWFLGKNHFYNKGDEFEFANNGQVFIRFDRAFVYPEFTINDFINFCNLAGIELRFNKSNETIKKLFGEVKK